MNPLMQISEVSVKVCFVGRPRQSIHPRGGIAFEREERHPQAVDADVVPKGTRERPFLPALAPFLTLFLYGRVRRFPGLARSLIREVRRGGGATGMSCGRPAWCRPRRALEAGMQVAGIRIVESDVIAA